MRSSAILSSLRAELKTAQTSARRLRAALGRSEGTRNEEGCEDEIFSKPSRWAPENDTSWGCVDTEYDR